MIIFVGILPHFKQFQQPSHKPLIHCNDTLMFSSLEQNNLIVASSSKKVLLLGMTITSSGIEGSWQSDFTNAKSDKNVNKQALNDILIKICEVWKQTMHNYQNYLNFFN